LKEERGVKRWLEKRKKGLGLSKGKRSFTERGRETHCCGRVVDLLTRERKERKKRGGPGGTGRGRVSIVFPASLKGKKASRLSSTASVWRREGGKIE